MTARSRAGISGVLRIAVAVRTGAFATQAGRFLAGHALLTDFTKDANMANTILQPDARGIAEERKAQPAIHHVPHGFSDQFALGFDMNHGYSSKLGGQNVDRSLAAPYPEHATEVRLNA